MTPWVQVSSQITSFMCFILEKQTDYDCTDVATVKVSLITCLLHWHCNVVLTTLLESAPKLLKNYCMICEGQFFSMLHSMNQWLYIVMLHFLKTSSFYHFLMSIPPCTPDFYIFSLFIWFFKLHTIFKTIQAELVPTHSYTHRHTRTEPCLYSPAVDFGRCEARTGRVLLHSQCS